MLDGSKANEGLLSDHIWLLLTDQPHLLLEGSLPNISSIALHPARKLQEDHPPPEYILSHVSEYTFASWESWYTLIFTNVIYAIKIPKWNSLITFPCHDIFLLAILLLGLGVLLGVPFSADLEKIFNCHSPG